MRDFLYKYFNSSRVKAAIIIVFFKVVVPIIGFLYLIAGILDLFKFFM